MSRRPLLIVVLLLAVVGALFALFGRRAPAPLPPPPPPPVQATATPEPEVEVKPPEPARQVVRTETYFEPLDDGKITAEQAMAISM